MSKETGGPAITDLQATIKELRELMDEATPGEWHWDADPMKTMCPPLFVARVCTKGKTITQAYYADDSGKRDAALIAAMKNALPDLLRALEARGEPVALNVRHPDGHKAADAFWKYWQENGETHKHGYYESTWGAINAALRMVGVVNATPPGTVRVPVELAHMSGQRNRTPCSEHTSISASKGGMMSQTPRTDPVVQKVEEAVAWKWATVVPAEFARQLETELAAMRERADVLEFAAKRAIRDLRHAADEIPDAEMKALFRSRVREYEKAVGDTADYRRGFMLAVSEAEHQRDAAIEQKEKAEAQLVAFRERAINAVEDVWRESREQYENPASKFRASSYMEGRADGASIAMSRLEALPLDSPEAIDAARGKP